MPERPRAESRLWLMDDPLETELRESEEENELGPAEHAADAVVATEDAEEVAPPEDREEPPPLDPEVAARRARALAHVRKFGDPVLKARAVPVERFDSELQAEVAHMAQLMGDAIGIGLAATQVGVMHRVLVYRIGQEAPLAVLVNPELDWSGDEREPAEEGCLSLPGIHVEVERPIHVRVRANDEYGDGLLIEASGLEARVIQHEIDHLDGVLMVDRIPREARKEAMRELREALDARAA